MKLKLKFGNKYDKFPLMIINIYICMIMLLYIFGPIDFYSEYNFYMIIYLSIFLIFINIFYFLALGQDNRYSQVTLRNNGTDFLPLSSWIYLLGLFIPLFMFINSVLLVGISNFDINLGYTMAKIYTFVQSGGKLNEGLDIPMWLYMHFGIFVYISLIDSIVFFRKISFFRKMIFFLILFFLLGYFILFNGTQKTLGDVFIIIISAVIVNTYFGIKIKQANKRNILISPILAVVAIIFALILANIMGERIMYLQSIGYDAFPLDTKFWKVNLDYPLLSFLPDKLKLGVSCLVFYLCNGLCGLAYCLGTPMTWSYGFGMFLDLVDIINRYTGVDFFQQTYPYQAYLTFGWHYNEQWHTIFPWIASDMGFFGAIIFMCIVVYMYSLTWQDILYGRNKESIYLFSLLNIMWIYLPANNQLLQTRTTEIIFLICLFMWIWRKRNG